MSTSDNTSERVVSVSSLTIVQGGQTVLEDVNFEVEAGEFIYLIGKTGSGKTSLLKTLYADLPIRQGEVQVNGYQVNGLAKKDIPKLRRTLGIVFQNFELFKDRTIYENFAFVLQAVGVDDKAEISQRAEALLDRVGLSGMLDKMPHQLSGGEQQRAAIARALVNDPMLVLADEPTGNLDPLVARDIQQLFVALHREGKTIIMATHNHNFLKVFPSRVIYCDQPHIRDLNREQVLRRIAQT